MKKPSKNTVETIKTVLIAVLITAIVAFIGGMRYEAEKQADLNTARTASINVAPVKK